MPLIDPGTRAPDFEALDQHGHRRRLRDYAGRTVVLYFYPEDDTPGCTDEACQFRDHFPKFDSDGAVILGVSPNSADSHRVFAGKFVLPFTLLADTELTADGAPKVCDAYGVWGEKNLYGHRSVGVRRATYLIDGEGVVRRRWGRVSINDAAEVLEAVRALTTAATAPRRKRAAKSASKPARRARKATAKPRTKRMTPRKKAKRRRRP